MIWHNGRFLPLGDLRVDTRDRSLEHGLGLFETFRTWNGWPSTWPLQRARLLASARALGLPEPLPAELPTEADIVELAARNGHLGDAVLRLTLTGGSDTLRPTLWLATRPLPAPAERAGLLVRATWAIDPDEPLLAHKTLNYWPRRLRHELAAAAGYDEELTVDFERTRLFEGTRSNLFVIRDGTLHTPSSQRGLLPGVMRRILLECASEICLPTETTEIGFPLDRLNGATELFLTNAVRGILPVRRLELAATGSGTPAYPFDTPGAITGKLMRQLEHWHARQSHKEIDQ